MKVIVVLNVSRVGELNLPVGDIGDPVESNI